MGVPVFGPIARALFGTRNQRMVKRYLRIVAEVNRLEPTMRPLSDAQLREKTAEFRRRFKAGEKTMALMPEVFAVAREAMDRAVGLRNMFNPASGFDPSRLNPDVRALYDATKATIDATPAGEPIEDLLGCSEPVPSWQFVEVPNALYDAVRELYPHSKPPFRARPFDVQIIGGVVLSQGRIAEMKTGEGKTIVGPLACYLACCDNKQVHVVTVNDYLVQRDRDWTFPFFRALGLTVGAIHPTHMQGHDTKRAAYRCDVVYGTTSEFGFDYLRDNMVYETGDRVQRGLNYAIVDEVDSILIDEARTPLIISGQAEDHTEMYVRINAIVPALKKQIGEEDVRTGEGVIEAGDFTMD
ncbi:MAG: protein translocase subunit SecA, partial [Planctomycetota bacterium]